MTDNDYKSILEKLTLEEKASLCSGLTNWLTQPIKKDGVDIPAVWVSDGPSGMRKEIAKEGGGTNIMGKTDPAVCFPGAAATASSWDEALLEKVGAAIGREAKALKVCTVLGPGVNIKRGPLSCGQDGRGVGARRAERGRRHLSQAFSCQQSRAYPHEHKLRRGQAHLARDLHARV